MKLRILIAIVLSGLTLTGCGVCVGTGGGADAGSGVSVEARGRQAEQLADLLFALAVAAARPEAGAGWSGGWEECVTYVGHQVEFRASGSFGAAARGRRPKAAILAAVRAAGWHVAVVRNDPGFVSFDLSGRGVSGGMVIEDDGVELDVGTGCVSVSREDAERLTHADSVQSDG